MKNKLLKALWFISILNLLFVANDQAQASKIEGKEAESKNVEESYSLTRAEKIKLLKMARKTLQTVVEKKVAPQFTKDEINFSKKFNKKLGVFVTLKIKENLRGCIGNIFPYNKTLFESVVRNTINSAVYDSRFIPVTKGELDNIEIELSVLSEIKEIPSYNEFQIGYHGIIIDKKRAFAVFLPQVPTEQNWSRDETLSHLCVKAGLPPDAWKGSGIKFSVFTANVFNESEMLNEGKYEE